jgi:Domain of unknown function (DUF1707)
MSSNLPISSPYRSTPDAPITVVERDRLSTRLNAAFENGALEQDEYRTRLDQLFAATKLGELVPVVEGLPPLPTYENPAFVQNPGGQPGEVSAGRPSGRFSVVVLAVVAMVILLIAILFLFLI